MAKEKPTEAGKARADAIRAEIDRLTGAAPLEADDAGRTPEKPKLTPREFVEQWMAEHDKKRRDK